MDGFINLEFRQNERHSHQGSNWIVVREDVDKMEIGGELFDQRNSKLNRAE